MFNNSNNHSVKFAAKTALWITLLASSSFFINPLRVLAKTEGAIFDATALDKTDTDLVQVDLPNQQNTELLSSKISDQSELPINTTGITSIEKFTDFSSNATDLTLNPGENNDGMAQINSVSQFRDVFPGDWAFTALQSLVERYGCIAGYPNAKFSGNRAITRYEFAAGLNACLNRIQELIATATSDVVTKADLETLQRLQNEFSTELANLRGRVDAVEARTATLEDQQFSTTTKLYGFAWMNVTGGFSDGNIQRELGFRLADGTPATDTVDDPSPTLTGLVWLDFVTSFTGKDSLVLQLAMGTSAALPGPLANLYASAGLDYSFADFTSGPGAVNPGDVTVRELYYQFPVSDKLQFVVGPRFTVYRFIEGNQFSFAFTNGPPIFNYITYNTTDSTLVNAIDRGAGAVAMWDISDQLLLRVAYIGESNEYLPSPPFNSAADPNQGLFGGTNTLTAELTYKPSRTSNIRFLYNRTNMQGYDITGDGNRQLCCGLTEPFYGIADDGLGGDVSNGTADTFGINADWRITPKFGIFGRYTYGSTTVYPTSLGIPDGKINTQSFQFGMAFPDLGKEGAMGQLSFLIPMDIISGEEYLVSGNGDGGTWYEIEGSYFVPVSSNIALVPSFSVVVNPNNFDSNPTIFIGNLRTQFNF